VYLPLLNTAIHHLEYWNSATLSLFAIALEMTACCQLKQAFYREDAAESYNCLERPKEPRQWHVADNYHHLCK